MSDVLWTPSADRIESTEIAKLCRSLGLRASFAQLHDWSVQQPTEFWETVWDRYGIIGERGAPTIEAADRFRDTRF
ncbi:MAG: acetoacetate--CoA ligase, partial [Acidimicrobiales bacterium]|nr:acetoacetate--CoA ligase [Acidimicrobiales bacterium]